MNIDQKLVQAIRDAVNEAGQPDGLAQRLIAWMEAVVSGNEDVADNAAAARHLEVLYDATVLSKADQELS
jgi:hypothetical protein